MKRVLMVAFHFPPMLGSSGLQRTLKFCKYLPDCGWEPTVLTVYPKAYPDTGEDLSREEFPDLRVVRTRALDTARHLSLFGRYPFFLALPDRWSSWVIDGMREARHIIALLSRRKHDLPWVVDIRDPMVEDDYPVEKARRWALRLVERKSVEAASAVTVTAPGTADIYQTRYPALRDRIEFIPNGYDEEDFDFLGEGPDHARNIEGKLAEKITLLHSGIVYLEERDPRSLFQAIQTLLAKRLISRDNFSVKFRACRNEDALEELVREYGVGEIVSLLPPLPYREALEEMGEADGLLILQSSNCNAQIPAKIFEYMRIGKPIIAFTDPEGDTAQIVSQAKSEYLAPLDDKQLIAGCLTRFIKDCGDGRASGTPISIAQQFSRRRQAQKLGGLLDEVTRDAAGRIPEHGRK